jgi:hypothetical protein
MKQSLRIISENTPEPVLAMDIPTGHFFVHKGELFLRVLVNMVDYNWSVPCKHTAIINDYVQPVEAVVIQHRSRTGV